MQSNNAITTHDLEVRSQQTDGRPSDALLASMYSIPPAALADIKRVLEGQFGSGFSVENFFKSFELTLDGLNRAHLAKSAHVRELESQVVEKHIKNVELRAAFDELTAAFAAKEAQNSELGAEVKELTDLKTRNLFQLGVLEKLLEEYKESVGSLQKRIEDLQQRNDQAGDNLQLINKLKAEQEDLVDRLTRKIVFLAREAMKGRRMSFIRVLPDLQRILRELRWEVNAINGLLNSEAFDAASITATIGSSTFSVNHSQAANLISAGTRAERLTDTIAQFLEEYEFLSRRILGNVSDEATTTQDIGRASRGKIPGIEAIMKRTRLLNGRGSGSSSPTTSDCVMSDDSNDSGRVSLPSNASGSSDSGAGAYRYSALNRARTATSKLTKAVSPASHSTNWRARA
ncbi:hypothetical protein PQX77_016196 [Marasmius sp. AFHP31]|nr:hypothetical protein PQX77_016196 [Marasmius sp. AFHP31]